MSEPELGSLPHGADWEHGIEPAADPDAGTYPRDFADLGSDRLDAGPGGRRQLEGFDEPVTVWTVERAG